VGVCSFVARYCTVPLLIHLLLVVCPPYYHYFFNRMSTTDLYCCTALQSLPLLLRSIPLQVLLFSSLRCPYQALELVLSSLLLHSLCYCFFISICP
jgi:hypothetical protein